MSHADIRARMDAHTRRGNELLECIDEHLERGTHGLSPEHLARGAELETRLEEHVAQRDALFETLDRLDTKRDSRPAS